MIGDQAAFDELTLDELARERDPLLVRHLARDGELDLAGGLRILALLDRLDLVPQRFAVVQTLGRVLGQHHFGMDDARLAGEIMIPPEPFVMQPGRRAIGGGRDRTPAAAASDDLGRAVVDRHDGNPFTSRPATSVRRIRALSYARALRRDLDRKRVVKGKSVSVRVDLGGRRIITKTKKIKNEQK